jgi:hypothetical protein
MGLVKRRHQWLREQIRKQDSLWYGRSVSAKLAHSLITFVNYPGYADGATVADSNVVAVRDHSAFSG